jgi:hypothetical protein
MKRLLMFVALMCVFAPMVFGATIFFDRVTTYTGGAAIPSAKIPTITYRGYTGPTATGPWTLGTTVTDNVALPALEPAAGATLWYTVDASLDGMTSAKAAAKSKTVPFLQPTGPVLRDVQ